MDIFNPADLRALISHKGKWCVSMYMPTHHVGSDQQQDQVRLKNVLAEAEVKLLANGLRRPKVQQLMQPAEDLLGDKDFWLHQGDGLAIFLSNDFSATYRLASRFEPLLVINKSFHTKPLYPILNRVGKFYLLFISFNHIRLFEATADAIHEIDLDFPASLDEVQEVDDPKILRFFQAANQRLQDLLKGRQRPMILAGVEHVLPIFREVCTYENVLNDHLPGNPNQGDLKELHQEAYQIAAPVFEEGQKKAFERYKQLEGQQSGLAVSDLKTALRAATSGQVESLFVPLNEQKSGHYDMEYNALKLANASGYESEDLLDLAAAETILNSGQVFAIPRDQLPGHGDLAAILRFPIQS